MVLCWICALDPHFCFLFCLSINFLFSLFFCFGPSLLHRPRNVAYAPWRNEILLRLIIIHFRFLIIYSQLRAENTHTHRQIHLESGCSISQWNTKKKHVILKNSNNNNNTICIRWKFQRRKNNKTEQRKKSVFFSLKIRRFFSFPFSLLYSLTHLFHAYARTARF